MTWHHNNPLTGPPVDTFELVGSGGIEYTTDGIVSSRIYACAWDDRIRLAEWLQGWDRNAGGQLIRSAPQQDPDYPELYVSQVNVSHFDDEDGMDTPGATGQIRYKRARVEVFYRLPSQGLGFVFGDESMDFAGEFLNLSEDEGGGTVWASDGVVTGGTTPIGKIVPSVAIEIAETRVATLERNRILLTMGKVNADEFRGYPPGHVLYLGLRSRRGAQGDFTTPWDLTHRLIARPISWQHAYRVETGQWELVNVSGNLLYESADFGWITDRLPEIGGFDGVDIPLGGGIGGGG